jgi:hypothetical protein
VDAGLQRPPQDRAGYRHVKSLLLRADAVNVKRKYINNNFVTTRPVTTEKWLNFLKFHYLIYTKKTGLKA